MAYETRWREYDRGAMHFIETYLAREDGSQVSDAEVRAAWEALDARAVGISLKMKLERLGEAPARWPEFVEIDDTPEAELAAGKVRVKGKWPGEPIGLLFPRDILRAWYEVD